MVAADAFCTSELVAVRGETEVWADHFPEGCRVTAKVYGHPRRRVFVPAREDGVDPDELAQAVRAVSN